MVPGMIMLWHGAIVDIPSGWTLCDGTMGTPDLRKRFIRGAGVGASVGYRAGSEEHRHPFTGDGHAHTLIPGTRLIDSHPAGDIAFDTSTDPAVGITDYKDTRPLFHTLCYIMKL